MEETWYDAGRGAVTPWGRADFRREYADGISFYSTPSHGGFRLSAERETELDAFLQAAGMTAEAARMGYSAGWYEEDCCALAVEAAFPVVRNPNASRSTDELLDELRHWIGYSTERATR